MSLQDSVIRRALKWWFGWPASPSVSINIVVDFSHAKAYLTSLDAEPRVSVNHLIAGAIGRLNREYPAANARLVGRRILEPKRVGVGMPVSLVGHRGGSRGELSMMVLEDADSLSLVAIARRCTRIVSEERSGRPANPWVKRLTALAQNTPEPLLHRALDVMDRGMKNLDINARVFAESPVTAGLTNPGAAIPPDIEGVLARGASISLPQRLVHVTCLWGASAVQPEAIPIDGEVVIRPMLPLLLVFDHRIFDGVYASRLLMRMAEILKDPAAMFGADGLREEPTAPGP